MINYSLLIFVFFLSFALSLILTPLIRVVSLEQNILSKPGKRMVHTKPVPYLGGIAIYVSFVLSVLFMTFFNQQFRLELLPKLVGLLLGSTIIVILGVLDDLKDIKPFAKLFGQIAVVIILFISGFKVEVISNPFFGGEIKIPMVLSLIITTIWFLGLINAMNLIDGLDGLAAGITVIVCFSLFFVSLFLENHTNAFLFAILAGSALGFLRFNFYPAKIFISFHPSNLNSSCIWGHYSTNIRSPLCLRYHQCGVWH